MAVAVIPILVSTIYVVYDIKGMYQAKVESIVTILLKNNIPPRPTIGLSLIALCTW